MHPQRSPVARDCTAGTSYPRSPLIGPLRRSTFCARSTALFRWSRAQKKQPTLGRGPPAAFVCARAPGVRVKPLSRPRSPSALLFRLAVSAPVTPLSPPEEETNRVGQSETTAGGAVQCTYIYIRSRDGPSWVSRSLVGVSEAFPLSVTLCAILHSHSRCSTDYIPQYCESELLHCQD